MLEKRGKGKKAKDYVVFHILESGSFFPPRIEKPGLVVPCRQSFENTPPITNLLPHRCIYPRFSTIFHHFEYKGGGGGREGCAARNFPSGKSGKAGKKKSGLIGVEITMLWKTIFVIKRVTRKPTPFTFHPAQLSTHATFSLGHR